MLSSWSSPPGRCWGSCLTVSRLDSSDDGRLGSEKLGAGDLRLELFNYSDSKDHKQDKISYPDKGMPCPPRAFLDAGPMRLPLLLPMELTSEIPLAELISSFSKLRLFLVLVDAILSLVVQRSD